MGERFRSAEGSASHCTFPGMQVFHPDAVTGGFFDDKTFLPSMVHYRTQGQRNAGHGDWRLTYIEILAPLIGKRLTRTTRNRHPGFVRECWTQAWHQGGHWPQATRAHMHAWVSVVTAGPVSTGLVPSAVTWSWQPESKELPLHPSSRRMP